MGAVQTKIAGGDGPDVMQIIKRAKKSMVKIIVGERVSSGSGVVIPNIVKSKDAGVREYMAVTCFHVIKQMPGCSGDITIQIPSEGEKRFKGKIRAVFPAEDLAILSFEVCVADGIRDRDLPKPAMFPSDESLVKSGEDVFALGYHIGGDLKVTKGSHAGWEKDAGGIGNGIQIPERRGRMHITALINRGSSGGGLFSMVDGSLQGINDSAYHNHPDQLFFSNPVYVLKDMIAMLLEHGDIIRGDGTIVLRTPLFGFCTKPVDSVSLGFINEPKGGQDVLDGLIVTKVLKVSAAAAAGMKVGDVITHVRIGDVNHALASSEGYVRVEWNNQPVTLFDLFRRTSYETLKKGVTFTMYRESSETVYDRLERVVNASEAPYIGALKTVYHPFDREPLVAMVKFNGMVFQELRMNHFDVTKNPGNGDAMSAIQVYLQDKMQESFIILTKAEGAEAQRFKVNNRGPSLLLSLNGKTVSTLKNLIEVIESLSDKYIKLELWEKAGVKHVIFRSVTTLEIAPSPSTGPRAETIDTPRPS
jgi:S1-C subfamily serine protease